MRNRTNIFSGVDWITIGLYLALIIFGWVNILGATYQGEDINIFDFSQFYGKQMIWMILSVILGVTILIIDSKFFTTLAYPIFLVLFLLLLSVFVLGTEVKGAKSWIDLGFFRLQPSEFCKFATALALAKYLSTLNINFKDNMTKLVSLAIVMVPTLVIIVQDDTGTALVYTSMIFVLYREGLSGNFLLLGFLIALLSVLALIISKVTIIIILTCLATGFFITQLKTISSMVIVLATTYGGMLLIYFLDFEEDFYLYFIAGLVVSSLIAVFIDKEGFKRKEKLAIMAVLIVASGYTYTVETIYSKALLPHQKGRIDLLFGKIEDPQGIGYNVNQSKIAIGSGRFAGRGFLQGTQTKFKFVPEQRTDFIFCTVGEEWGFLGTSLVIILFMALLLRIIFLAERQRSILSRVYGYCVACIIFFHVMINLSMTIGLAPVIGIPLPFFSYGGSSLWGFTILLFIFLNFDSRRLEILR